MVRVNLSILAVVMALQFQREWQRIQKLCRRVEPKLRSRMTFASGALLSGALFLRFLPLPGINSSTQLEPLQENLWMSTGIVRQSVVDLYRVQRTRQQATDNNTAPSTNNPGPEVPANNALATTAPTGSTTTNASITPETPAAEAAAPEATITPTEPQEEQAPSVEAAPVTEAAPPPPAPVAAAPVDQNVQCH